mmetsp:Transcript_41763/g.118072  ORF Transcript_41763/g.118072 Transcript_41763/m.118072 type:complete len:237 (-) Transcript_41763:654-1364(-)
MNQGIEGAAGRVRHGGRLGGVPILRLAVRAPELAPEAHAVLHRLAEGRLPVGKHGLENDVARHAPPRARGQEHRLRRQALLPRAGVARARGGGGDREAVLHARDDRREAPAGRGQEEGGAEVPGQDPRVAEEGLQQLAAGGRGEALHPLAEHAAKPHEAVAPQELELGVDPHEPRRDAHEVRAEPVRDEQQGVEQLRVPVLREAGRAEAADQIEASLQRGFQELQVRMLRCIDLVD